MSSTGQDNCHTIGDIKSKICKIYSISSRSFDTYLSDYQKAKTRAIEKRGRTMEEMLGKPFLKFTTEYIAEYRKEHGEGIGWEDKMMDEYYEDYDIISRHFWPSDWTHDDP